jgi:DNA-binding IscR family transcriptional regulator
VRISAKADYAVRAAVTLAALDGDAPVKAERLADAQEIPLTSSRTSSISSRRAAS